MSDRTHVVVIGSGIIGTACAHYLQQAGCRVTILERGTYGAMCSHGNCGYVCPSHVLPLAAPGVLRSSLASMLKPNSPFYIKPRLSPTLWRWLLAFAWRCNRGDMLRAAQGIHALLQSSRALYDDLVQRERLDCEWQTRGLLFVFHSAHGMAHYAATDALIREHFGVAAQPYYGAALNELEPALKPGLGGGWHYEGDAHLRPDRLLRSWRALLEQRGVVVREQCDVQGFVRHAGNATAVRTTQGEIAADAFVLAAGALSPFLNDHLGCRLPIQPGKGYSITMPRPAQAPTLPMIFEEHRVAVTPMATGYRLGSMMEFVGYDTSIKPKRLRLLSEAAKLYLHDPVAEPIQETWFGWRPMTTDSLPIIDRSPALGNVVIAAGHNMLGLSMAPATGKLVSELLTGVPPHLDATPFHVRRFG
jgi:D-amino-acid dehydrogenase